MKIINAIELWALPVGTIFSEYYSDCIQGLNRKGKTLDHDFFYSEIMPTNSKSEIGAMCRNGNFDEDQLFIIYTKEEMTYMKSLLS